MLIYADTSALLKRYIAEPASDEFDEFLLTRGPLDISRLTLTEMRCALSRRRRAAEINAAIETSVVAELRKDVLNGVLRVCPVNDSQVIEAYALIESLPGIPLRTLDAIHLAIAREIAATALATSDKIQAQAARILGFTVFDFS